MPGMQARMNTGAASVLRILERRKRLEQALERAEGDRKVSLQAEFDALVEQEAQIRAALDPAAP